MLQPGRQDCVRSPLSHSVVDAVRAVVPLVDTLPGDRNRGPEALVEVSLRLVGVDEAVVMLLPYVGGIEVVASSGKAVGLLCTPGIVDPRGGPGGEAACGGRPVLIEPSAVARPGDDAFTCAAAALGFGLVQALPLGEGRDTLGSLVVFGRHPAALGPPERRMLQVLAQVAAAGLRQRRATLAAEERAAQFERALVSRVVIEQAKGALLARGAADLAGAFRALRGHARSHNLRLEDVARQVVGRAAHEDGRVL